MNRPPPAPPPPRSARPAAHVQAALARSAQPRMPDRAQPARWPPIAPPPVVFRTAGPAPHVAAVQARMATPAPPPVRNVAPHVQAALGRGVQAKLAPAPTPRAAVAQPVPARHPMPRSAPAPTPRVIQRMNQPVVQDDGVTRGQVRDGDTVTTAGGTWTAARYVAITRYDFEACHGAFMRLEFEPKAPADATKIALVQSVTVAKNKRMYYMNETIKNRSVVGTSIDQDQSSRSPLYVEKPGTGGGGLGSSEVATDPQAGDHGYRYHDGDSWQVKKAWLKDMPHLRGVNQFSFQVFETTALALAGNDAGKYYGSVKWGWWESNGGVLLVPLQKLSHGSVTEEFKASLKRWNETQTSEGATPQQLPDPS